MALGSCKESGKAKIGCLGSIIVTIIILIFIGKIADFFEKRSEEKKRIEQQKITAQLEEKRRNIEKKIRITTLEKKVKGIPVAKATDNLRIYNQLLRLDSENPKYKKKVAFYQAKVDEQKRKAQEAKLARQRRIARDVIARESNLTSQQRALITQLENQGLIQMKCGKVYIDRSLWNSMTYQTKDDFCATLAIACAERRHVDVYWVDVYDLHSGKKLAKWSRNWDFKVY